MTALIIGLIAAVGIGGGVAIANNSGGHGGSSPAIVETNTGNNPTANPAANLTPDYELISALTDTDQYELTLATSDSLSSQVNTASARVHAATLMGVRRLPAITDPRYGNPEDDLANGEIRGNEIGSCGLYTTLALKEGTGVFSIVSSKVVATGDNTFTQEIQEPFDLTYGDNLASKNTRYWTFTQTDTPLTLVSGNTVHHYNSIHLGGAPLHLTVADFGHWEEKGWVENTSGVFQNLYEENNKTFFFYDDNFAYAGSYHKDVVPMEGNVLVSAVTNKESATPYDLQTGSISFTLDLANKTIRDGNVIMDNEAYRAEYDVSEFTGEIDGSVFSIDGTGWRGEDPQAGQLRGGVGELLIGKYGLEAVGNFTKQITGTEESGKADYTFGAIEQ